MFKIIGTMNNASKMRKINCSIYAAELLQA